MSSASAAVAAILRVFLDCSSGSCHEEYLRETVKLADYVRDRNDADVHVLVTKVDTSAGGDEFTLAFIGLDTFQSTTRTLRVVTEASDSDERVRRQLASALTLGLLSFLAPDSVPPSLTIEAALDLSGGPAAAPDRDRWRRWLFAINGYLNFDAEETTSESNWGVSAGADRITPHWKISLGSSFNESNDTFELDDGSELSVVRRNRSFNALAVKSLGEHWSIGATGEMRSSTFNNIELQTRLAPAIEWNFFPYSMYTRRQFRVLYSVGAARAGYYEETLFGKLDEALGGQELSATYEQRERWGTLEGRVLGSNYFPGFDRHRFEVDGEVDVRIARGLSLRLEASASRIRDQLSLPRRDASSEEVLLRLRQLRSGFETRFEIGVEYRFGSAFAAIVNPRFGS